MKKSEVLFALFVCLPILFAFLLRAHGSSIAIKTISYYIFGIAWAIYLIVVTWINRSNYQTIHDFVILLSGLSIVLLLCTWSYAICFATFSLQFEKYDSQNLYIRTYGDVCDKTRGLISRKWQLQIENNIIGWCSNDAQYFYKHNIRAGSQIKLFVRQNMFAIQVRRQIGQGIWKL